MENVIFDWSGTLVDDLPPVLEATNQIFAHYDRAVMDREEFRQTFRLPFADFYAEVLPGVPMEDLDVLYHKFFVGAEKEVTIFACSSRVPRILQGAQQAGVSSQFDSPGSLQRPVGRTWLGRLL